MHDKSKLGTRYVCFACGCKFYDLNRPTPLCPDCQADQNEAPTRDLKSLLSSRGRPARAVEKPPPAPVDESKDADAEEEEEEDAGLVGDLATDGA